MGGRLHHPQEQTPTRFAIQDERPFNGGFINYLTKKSARIWKIHRKYSFIGFGLVSHKKERI